MARQEQQKWEGKATAKLKGAKPQQIWRALIEDFGEVYKWLPSNGALCRQVEGVKGEVGAVRHLSSAVDGGGGEAVAAKWVREKLVNVDHGQRCMSYQVLDNNIGMEYYVATLKVLDGDDEFGCLIEWSYVADPVVGFTSEGFFGHINFFLQGMAHKMEKELHSQA